MDVEAIFGLQFLLSLVAWGLIGRWVLAPWFESMAPSKALFWLALPHAFRHVGMVFLVPGVVAQRLPDGFATPAAYGDLATGVLALLAIIALQTGWSRAVALVWLFNIVGTLDLLNALRHVDVAPSFGAAWYIPTMLVPLLLVTHFMMLSRLFRGPGEDGWQLGSS